MVQRFFKSRFTQLIFISAIAFNLLYWYFLFYRVLMTDDWWVILLANDFDDNFMPAVGYFLEDPNALYTIGPVLSFRNLPSAILYYIPFYFIPSSEHLDIITCSSFIILWNCGNCVLMYKISNLNEFKNNPHRVGRMFICYQKVAYLARIIPLHFNSTYFQIQI